MLHRGVREVYFACTLFDMEHLIVCELLTLSQQVQPKY